MRRKDRQITTESDIRTIIRQSRVCRLAMLDGDRPYIVPLCFGYQDGYLFFHSATRGKKIDLLRKNPTVCFEFDLVHGTVEADKACHWSIQYQSVVGFGKAIFIDNLEQKRQALGVIMQQYSDKAFKFRDNILKATAVFKVRIEAVTGKRSWQPTQDCRHDRIKGT